jgi:hypothetical protein
MRCVGLSFAKRFASLRCETLPQGESFTANASLLGNDAISNGQNDGVCLVLRAKLPRCFLGVMIDGSLADSENVADFVSKLSLGSPSKDVPLARRQYDISFLSHQKNWKVPAPSLQTALHFNGKTGPLIEAVVQIQSPA